MEIGKTNTLRINRATDNGLYLVDNEFEEVLLPNAYVTEELKIGDNIDVFIYKDSEDRLVATTEEPLIKLNEFAYLQVKDVNRFGAFIDWGLPKDLMVPFAEQNKKMEPGEWYLIFLALDEETNRLFGSNKVNDFVFFTEIDVKEGDEVDLLLYEMNDLGMQAIVNNLYKGLIFKSDIHKEIKAGERLKGYVKNVRDDGKIDILLEPMGYKNVIDKNSDLILSTLKEKEGFLKLSDKSTPEEIKEILGMSKKNFKKVIGNLYKKKLIEITNDGIRIKK